MKSKVIFEAFEAKTRLSGLIKQVNRGEVITITLSGKPVAQLVPFNQPGRAGVKEAFRQLDEIALRHPLNPPGKEKISYRELIVAGRR
jgi:prevent-host-death family protein